jgi:hypothetical protein
LRVTDAGNGSSGGLSIESYQPTIQLIDWSTSAKNSRIMQNAGQILFSNDTAGEGTFLAAGVSLSPDGYMSVGAGSLSNNVSYYAQGPTVGTGATQYGFYHVAEFNSAATANGYAFAAAPKVKDAAFTMAQLTGFLAATPTVGASATVTTYAAFNAKDFSGAGSVYGFRGQISAGTNKWNLYNDGSALNYLNGKLLVGTNIDDGYSKLQVSGVVKGVAAQKAIVASNGSGTGQTSMFLTREGAATDEKNWEILHNSSNTFVIRSIDDAYSTSQNALVVNRPTGGGVALTTMQLMGGGGRVLVGTTTDDGASTLQLGTGNLAFTGASQRITGDFTNATFASRAYFQTSTANSTSSVGVLPSGTGASANFAAYSAANPTNSSRISITALTGEARITADNIGTGTLPAMTFYANAAERMRVSTSGRVLVNTTTDTGIGQLQVTGGIATSTYDAQGANIRINGGSTQDVMLRQDASNFYLLLSSTAGGSFNTLRPLSVNVSTGALNLDGTGVGTSHGGGVWSTAAAAKVPGTGVFRSQGEIGGAFVDWNSGTPRSYALQVDAIAASSAYGGIRWTRWAGRHLAAIDAYEGGTTSSQPSIVMHVANQNNAWTFNNTDILRGAGGTVYGTWNLNPANYLPVAGGWMNGQLTMGNASTILLQGQGNTYSASLRADSSGMVGFINNAQNAFNLQISDAGFVTIRGGASIGARPTWAGLFPWDSGNSAGSFGTNGYQRLGSGLLVQWGLGTAGANAASVLNYFPIAFPGFCAHVTAAHVGTDATVNIILDANYQGNVNAFGARSNYGAANVGIYWIAVGW